MKTTTILLPAVTLTLLTVSLASSAQERSRAAENPRAENVPAPRSYRSSYASQTRHQPAPIERLQMGTKKFFTDAGTGTKRFFDNAGAGTKRFFAGARDALTWNKPEPERKPTNQYIPWKRDPHSGQFRQFQPKPEKKPWLSSWFRPAKPKPVKTFEDWWALERSDP